MADHSNVLAAALAAALVALLPATALAGHASGHDNTCVLAGGYETIREGGGEYHRFVEQTCVVSIEDNDVCLLARYTGEYHAGAGGSSAETSERGTCAVRMAQSALRGDAVDPAVVYVRGPGGLPTPLGEVLP